MSRAFASLRLFSVVTLATAVGAGAAGCAPPSRLVLFGDGSPQTQAGLGASDFADATPAAVSFTGALLSVTAFSVKDGGTEIFRGDGPFVFDAARGQAQIGFDDIATGTYSDVTFQKAPAGGIVAGDVDARLITRMTELGASILVEGETVRGVDTVRFSWPLLIDTLHRDCFADDGGLGVSEGIDAAWTVTAAFERLFDTALAGGGPLRFDAIAAADGAAEGGADGNVSLEELAAVELSTLPDYDTGGDPGVVTLRQFIERQAHAIGGCSPERR